MPATVPTRGVLKPSQNRVRTSVALQGSNMWENVIGIVNEERGANQGVEALINAPQHGVGRKKAQARREAAAEAVKATGGFDTAITSYETLLSLAKSQGAVGGNADRGACKICGQTGHLTKQCRNQFSKYYSKDEAAAAGATNAMLPGNDDNDDDVHSDSSLSSLLGNNSSSSSDSDSSADERRKRKRKKSSSSRDKKKKHKKKSSKEKKSKKSKKRRRRHTSSDSD